MLFGDIISYNLIERKIIRVHWTLTSESLAYKIGEYAVDKDGTVTGPASKELVEALEAKGFTSKNEEGENDHE